MAPVGMHFLPFIIKKINNLTILDVLHLWSTCKYFGRRVGTSLDNSNNANSSSIHILSTAVGLHGVKMRTMQPWLFLPFVLASLFQMIIGECYMLQRNQPKTREKKFLASGRDLTQNLEFPSLLPCHLSHHTSSVIPRFLHLNERNILSQ